MSFWAFLVFGPSFLISCEFDGSEFVCFLGGWSFGPRVSLLAFPMFQTFRVKPVNPTESFKQ